MKKFITLFVLVVVVFLSHAQPGVKLTSFTLSATDKSITCNGQIDPSVSLPVNILPNVFQVFSAVGGGDSLAFVTSVPELTISNTDRTFSFSVAAQPNTHYAVVAIARAWNYSDSVYHGFVQTSPTGIVENGMENLKVYTSQNTIVLDNLPTSLTGVKVNLINLIGQSVANFSLTGATRQEELVAAPHGIYIVTFETGGRTISRKILIE